MRRLKDMKLLSDIEGWIASPSTMISRGWRVEPRENLDSSDAGLSVPRVGGDHGRAKAIELCFYSLD